MFVQHFRFIYLLIFSLWSAELGHAQPAEIVSAARAGNLEKVKDLLASGAQPDPEGIATPLYFAAQGGYIEIVQLLLEKGADPNAQSDWGTPLHIAARRKHVDIVTELLQKGADPNSIGGELNNTPLHEAAYSGDTEVTRLLITLGSDVNARNNEFEPPIHLALENNRTAVAEMLREAGARPIDVIPISSELAQANIEAGRARALECGVCHQLTKDKENVGSGPRLWGVVGRPIASEEFDYTDALKAETGSWTFERLNAFIADPAGTVPGSGMYRGYVQDRTERINLIAYLRTLSDSPIPLP